jgi:hypothetical protein
MGIRIRGVFGGMLSLSCYMRLGVASMRFADFVCGLLHAYIMHVSSQLPSVLPLDCDLVWLLWRGNVGVGRMGMRVAEFGQVSKRAYCSRDPISISSFSECGSEHHLLAGVILERESPGHPDVGSYPDRSP